ncbi:MAG: hypothetical protein IPO43_20005 [Rhodoferax sp.]|nr:hypothetical protein [Rhodoferax sp.]
MDQREYQVASRPFAEAGTSIRTKLWYSRLNKLHAELLTDIPALRSLRASELELNFNPTAANVHLTAFLVESAQLSISYATKGREVEAKWFRDHLDGTRIDDTATV